MQLGDPTITWQYVVRHIQGPGLEGAVSVRRSDVPHPGAAGATRSTGMPAGQSADWRFPPSADRRGVHVQAVDDNWRVHVDEVHPGCDPFEHARRDAPVVWCLGTAAVGAAMGKAIGKPVAGALVGALVGLLTLPAGQPA